jgi:5-methyltetrahydrofolate--homocysteine methyltransferase
MQEVVKRLRSSVEAPLVIDSTEPEVLQTALETYPGRATINSINLEGGRAKADRVLDLAAAHGAAVIALTIDEQGMAHTAERKLAIARRMYELACDEHGMPPEALIFDVLTFPVTTGQADLRDDAHETIEGIRAVKAELPGALTILGLSNVSFGISLAARGALNSVFLYHCVQAGLDLAIVNPVHLTPYAEIPTDLRALAEDLIYNRREDALPRFLAAFEGVEVASKAAASDDSDLPLDERIHHRILHRQKEGIEALLDDAIQQRQPLKTSEAAVAVLNDVLLPAMKDVGDRFGAGELILPFVLQSAEVMKRAVAHLEQYLEKQAGYSKGTIVVATVFGDVHDIGKSLLITILSNNGYTVHDLGKQVPANTIIDAAIAHQADAIGLSALLVSTSKQMPICIQELDARGLHIPVLVGGAAINRAFGRRSGILPDGRLYEPGVFYCKDVFEGLATMDTLQDANARDQLLAQVRTETVALRDTPATPVTPRVVPKASAGPRQDLRIPRPTTWGVQVIDAELPDVWRYLDKNTLFRHHWGGHRAKGDEYSRIVADVFESELARLQADARSDGWLQAHIVLGTFACNADGDSLILWSSPDSRQEVARLTFPRQPSGDQLCLADYFRSIQRPETDVIVLQAVTVGPRAGEYIEELQRSGDYSRMLYVNGLASSTAEALAEFGHRAARTNLGVPDNQGLRYSWGYQACPDLSQQRIVLDLLDAEARIGLRLSESNHLDPEHSTAAMVVHHPEAKYFAVRSE